MTTRLTRSCVIGVLLFGLAACQDEARDAAPTANTQKLSDSIEAGYEHLQRAYESADTLAPEVRKVYGAMGRMHGQMREHRRGMGGPMHSPGGMHGEGRHRMNGEKARQRGQMREWHQQMMGMHGQMARMHGRRGQSGMAARHRQLERRHRKMTGALPSNDEEEAANGGAGQAEQEGHSGARDEASAVRGDLLYARQCATCHGQKGRGLGAFPPLAGSSWVTGEEDRLIRILLHGLEGSIEVRDRTFNNVMPAFGRRLSDVEIAAILSYVRSSWGNDGETVEPEEVLEVRREYADRVQPWRATHLRDEK